MMLQLTVASENLAELSKSLGVVSSEVQHMRCNDQHSELCPAFAALLLSSQETMSATVDQLKVLLFQCLLLQHPQGNIYTKKCHYEFAVTIPATLQALM